MPSPDNKKLNILYLLKVMQEYTDENHVLTQTEIADKIENVYGMKIERKTVAANLEALSDIGYDIIKVPNKGYYLGERELEPSEISFLVDALFSGKAVSSKQAQALSSKLYSCLSRFERRKYNYIYKSAEISRFDNKQLFYSIDTIYRAIEAHKRIRFDYIGYTAEEGKVSKPAKVAPYFLINNNGRYYLVCCRRREWGLSNYRIERMENVTITEDDVFPENEIAGCENGIDIAKYANEKLYMFGGETVHATLCLDNDSAISFVYDWFGNDARIYRKNGQLFAAVTANESALGYWVIQYGQSVELVSPASTRAWIKTLVDKLADRYKEKQ